MADTPTPQDSPWPTPDQPHPAWPTPAGTPLPPSPSQGPASQVWGVLSSPRRDGQWQIPEQFSASSLLGDVRLDLREAQLSAHETTISASSLLGQVKIIVPDTYRIECAGNEIAGEFKVKESGPCRHPAADAPLIRFVGVSVLADITIYRTAAPVGLGGLGVDGLAGVRRARRLRRANRRRGIGA